MIFDEQDKVLEFADQQVKELVVKIDSHIKFMGIGGVSRVVLGVPAWAAVALLLRHRELLKIQIDICENSCKISNSTRAYLTAQLKWSYWLCGVMFVIAFFLGFFAGSIR